MINDVNIAAGYQVLALFVVSVLLLLVAQEGADLSHLRMIMNAVRHRLIGPAWVP